MIRSLLFWNIFPLAPILLKTLIACQQRKIKNQSTTSERFNMCHIERVSTAYSHVIASPANCTISPSVWNVFLWNINQLGAEVLFNTLIYSRCMPECFSVSCVHPCCPSGTASRTEAPCSPWGEGLRREMKGQQFKEEIKTKLNLFHLKSGGGLCLFCAPFTDPSLSFLCCCPQLTAAPDTSLLPWAAQPAQPTVTKRTSISPFLMDFLSKRGEAPSFCQWRSRHPVPVAGTNPAAPVTGSNSQPGPFADPPRSEWRFFT